MEHIMTDYLYTSGANSFGFSDKKEILNKEVMDYPAPNVYESKKNDKIVEPEIRQRSQVAIK